MRTAPQGSGLLPKVLSTSHMKDSSNRVQDPLSGAIAAGFLLCDEQLRGWPHESQSQIPGSPVNSRSRQGLIRPSFDSKNIHAVWTNFWNSCCKSSQQRTLGHTRSPYNWINPSPWLTSGPQKPAGWLARPADPTRFLPAPCFYISTSHLSGWVNYYKKYLPQRQIIKRDSRGQHRSGACIHENSEMKIPSQP